MPQASQTPSAIDLLDPNADPSGADPSVSSAATQRVLAAMERSAIPAALKMLPPEVRTPEQIADFCDCEINYIVLSTVFRGKTTKKPMMLLHSAASAISEKLIGQLVGENLQRADADFVTRLTGYAIGAVPPIGLMNRFPVMFDGSLMRFARVWCTSGAPDAVISVPTQVLVRAIAARVVRLEP